MKKRILFVAPTFENNWNRMRQHLGAQRKAPSNLLVPLQFATLAAVTPEDEFETDIWDESWRGTIEESTDLGKQYDLIGVTGYEDSLSRMNEIGQLFRKRGILTVAGGPGVTGAPEVCRESFDVLFLGEAEMTWPRFLQDWQKQRYQTEYRQVERIDLSISPLPKWDSIAKDVRLYPAGAVQTTRGCPYDCDFCDVIHLFGRKPRHKPIENVIQEIVALERLGVSRVFICDDEFVGDKKYTKDLLRALIPVNNAFKSPLIYSTQATITCANDDELLELLADCNFHQLYMGIETPRSSSLKEANKLQNLRNDLVESCKKIQSYGIAVRALMIAGFDADDASIFDEHIKFLEDANIAGFNTQLLKAYPGTPLWVRMQRQNRVFKFADTYATAPKVHTNIIPKQMPLIELYEGFRDFLTRANSPERLERLATGFMKGVTRQPKVRTPSLRELMRKSRRISGGGKVPRELRRLIIRMAVKTCYWKPYMLERVLSTVAIQSRDLLMDPLHREVIQHQIDLVRANELEMHPDPSVGTVPPDFRRKVRDVLPSIYDQLEAGIEHKSAIPTAMLGVIKDFVIRWGQGFTEFGPQHDMYLKELCGRHIERYHESKASQRDLNGSNKGFTHNELRHPNFIQALMAGVEQDLRSTSPSSQAVLESTT